MLITGAGEWLFVPSERVGVKFRSKETEVRRQKFKSPNEEIAKR